MPAIADKVRSYGGAYHASRRPVAGPAREIARRARSYMGMAWVGQRRRSHPRIAPGCPAIADKVRSYGEACRASRRPVAGPARDFARRARSYMGMAGVGQPVGWVERSDTHRHGSMGFASSTHPTKSTSAQPARQLLLRGDANWAGMKKTAAVSRGGLFGVARISRRPARGSPPGAARPCPAGRRSRRAGCAGLPAHCRARWG